MPELTSIDPAASAEARAQHELYLASQTFLLRRPDPRVFVLRAVTISAILLFFFVAVPLLTARGQIQDYKVNVLGKYLCFAIVALGIDLVWGYTGLLSLCQALFFAVGAYAMGMHLSLKEGGGDVRSEYNNIPQFMFFNNLHELPLFWRPFSSLIFSVVGGLAISGAIAALLGFFVLRNRVRGVYFSIVTQAFAAAAWLLISRNEMLLGGTNGLTNFYKPMMQERRWIIGLYLVTLFALLGSYLLCWLIVRSRLGRVLVAIRDKETRLYFAGYKPHAFKVFALTIGAMLAAVGGMLYSPQVGIITPQDMNVEASIIMVIMLAIGGRGHLWGAIFGAVLLSQVQSSLTSDLPSLALCVRGLIAIGVVLMFPDGFVGVWQAVERELTATGSWVRAAVVSLPLLAVTAFLLGESLGCMPEALNRTFSALHVNLGRDLAIALLLAALGLYMIWAQRSSGISWGAFAAMQGLAALLLILHFTRIIPPIMKARDGYGIELQWKYVALTLVFVALGVMNRARKPKLAAVEPDEPAAASTAVSLPAVAVPEGQA